MSVAAMAARFCARPLADGEGPSVRDGEVMAAAPKRPWRRAARTKAALARKQRAMDQAILVLEGIKIAFTQPVAGKLVIEPPRGTKGGRTVTFWPARERLRIGRRPTKKEKGIGDLKEAIAAQGHRVPGYLYRHPLMPKPRRNAREERRRERREAKLAQLEKSLGDSLASLSALVEKLRVTEA